MFIKVAEVTSVHCLKLQSKFKSLVNFSFYTQSWHPHPWPICLLVALPEWCYMYIFYKLSCLSTPRSRLLWMCCWHQSLDLFIFCKCNASNQHLCCDQLKRKLNGNNIHRFSLLFKKFSNFLGNWVWNMMLNQHKWSIQHYLTDTSRSIKHQLKKQQYRLNYIEICVLLH